MSRTNVVVVIVAVVLLGAGVFLSLSGLGGKMFGPLNSRLRLTPKMQLVLQVQVQDAVNEEADRVVGSLQEDLRRAQIPYTSVDRNDPASIEQVDTIRIGLKGIPAARQNDLRGLISQRFPGWVLTPVSLTDYGLTPGAAELAALKRETVERTLARVEERLRDLGVAESAFRRSGGGPGAFEIVVQISSGVDDPARLKQIVTTRAHLEIAPVKDGPFHSREEALAKYGGVLPLETRLTKGVPLRGEASETWYLLSRTPVITGNDLRKTSASRDEMGRWETDFTLNKVAAQRFGRYTESNIGNRLAIVLDELVRTAPTIQSRIEDSGVIHGAVNRKEASDLALVLRSGSLPARVFILEERMGSK